MWLFRGVSCSARILVLILNDGMSRRVVFPLSSCGLRYLNRRSGKRYCRLFVLNQKGSGGKYRI